jgi:putative phosphoribosyl transferase
MERPFADRFEAGRLLGERLRARGVGVSRRALLLGIPRGGVVVAAEAARVLDADLDALVVTKIRSPEDPELALGAVGPGGMVVGPVVDRITHDPRLEASMEAARSEQAQREALYGRRDWPRLTARDVVVVDDGLATGASAMAAAQVLHALGAERFGLAVPVGPPDVVERLGSWYVWVEVLRRPRWFYAVSQAYERFENVDTEVVLALLAQSPPSREYGPES